MCTAISFKSGDTYFGRNLDLERGFGEQVVVTPRNYEFKMRHTDPIPYHYAMIGMAVVKDDYPLYFEATNEKGVSAAGLNFPGNAHYNELVSGMDNVAPFEFIPWILSRCASLAEVKEKLRDLNLARIDFSLELPLSPLHWMISDCKSSIVVESTAEGMRIWDNPFEVLTNNPPFEYHQMNMSNYMALSTRGMRMEFPRKLPMENYSLGMGAMGLPGDYSSMSRFVRASYVKENSVCAKDEESSVNQFFHILDAVAMPKGCVWTENGYEYTRYSCCCNAQKGVYYYKTYEDWSVKRVDMHEEDLNSEKLSVF